MEDGLREAIRIIEDEAEVAKRINPIMCMGMLRIKDLIEERIKLEGFKNQ